MTRYWALFAHFTAPDGCDERWWYTNAEKWGPKNKRMRFLNLKEARRYAREHVEDGLTDVRIMRFTRP